MKVNTAKTQIVCMPDALSYKVGTFIEDADGFQIGTKDTMKILGYTLSDRLGCHAQVQTIHKKFRQR